MNKGYVGTIIQIIALLLLIAAPNGYLAWVTLWFLGCQFRLGALEEENQHFRKVLQIYQNLLVELKEILTKPKDHHESD